MSISKEVSSLSSDRNAAAIYITPVYVCPTVNVRHDTDGEKRGVGGIYYVIRIGKAILEHYLSEKAAKYYKIGVILLKSGVQNAQRQTTLSPHEPNVYAGLMSFAKL